MRLRGELGFFSPLFFFFPLSAPLKKKLINI